MNNIENQIKVEGINCKGYGITGKAVMLDTDLSLTAKAIYAYFCSFGGAGAFVFPRRETILHDLKLSKNGYYKHYKTLIENNYLRIEKKKGYLNKNTYVIVANPNKLKESKIDAKSESCLMLNGVLNQGFGFIPKAVMQDQRLDVKAKGLIAYFYCLAQNGSCVFPSRKDTLYYLNISTTAYYNALHQLTDCDYINIQQRTNSNGQFAVNDYILNTFPNSTDSKIDETPCVQNEDNVENLNNSTALPCTQNEDSDFQANIKQPCVQNEDIETLPCVQNGDYGNEDNNNITSINNILYNTSFYHYTISGENENEYGNKCEHEEAYPADKVYQSGLPYHCENKTVMTSALRTLAMVDDIKATATDNNYKRTYIMAVNCLIDMCTSKQSHTYRDTTVTAIQATEQLNLCCMDDDYGLSLRDFLYEVCLKFIQAGEKYNINSPCKYMKSVLWSCMCTFV